MQPDQDPKYWHPSTQPQADLNAPAQTEIADDPTSAQEPTVGSRQTDAPLSWQASEFVHHEKDGRWFLGLLAVALVLLLLDFFVIKSWTFAALIVVMTIAVIVLARRPPRIIDYTLSAYDLQIDEKQFALHDFRAFGVVQENAFYTIRLIPNKRFMPMVTVFFPLEHGEEIVDVFGQALPMETIERDTLDRIAEKIRF
mgnify:FL=1